jgi:hypothetical protein
MLNLGGYVTGTGASKGAAATAYDMNVDVYGVVDHVDIRSPALSPELRDAINAKVLDGLPLTRSFNNTPLFDLANALIHL